ncbi:hypothetical protein FA13DRAFT_278988 [Coprinellus micaceus]|uniref:Uncharacterized protein n=1 Tax=Coprinellus micaceus TaxID=71717 RepID=A0A4Y7SE36_COPMI|nr:hypothetical protein FA13DRAFT_278988 [Coprinellus micaceus]
MPLIDEHGVCYLCVDVPVAHRVYMQRRGDSVPTPLFNVSPRTRGVTSPPFRRNARRPFDCPARHQLDLAAPRPRAAKARSRSPLSLDSGGHCEEATGVKDFRSLV